MAGSCEDGGTVQSMPATPEVFQDKYTVPQQQAKGMNDDAPRVGMS